MDFSAPYRVITPTLEGPILRALARAGTELTRSQILALVEDASEAGVRKALARLVDQGIVMEERIGSRYTYEANREHLLWPAVEGLLRARELLRERVRKMVLGWAVPPVSVELFGSVARGRPDSGSDIDLLVLRPPVPGAGEQEIWEQQIGDLRDHVVRWTGNGCDIVVLGPDEFAAAAARDDEIVRPGHGNLAGQPLADVPRELTPSLPRAWIGAAQAAAAAGRTADLDAALTQAAVTTRGVAAISARMRQAADMNGDAGRQFPQAGTMVAAERKLDDVLRDIAAAQTDLRLSGERDGARQ